MFDPAENTLPQPYHDKNRVVTGLEEEVITIYFSALGLTWKCITYLIAYKIHNCNMEDYMVNRYLRNNVEKDENVYDKESDMYHLWDCGAKLRDVMLRHLKKIDEEKWNKLTVVGDLEQAVFYHIDGPDYQRMKQKAVFEHHNMTLERMCEIINDGFYNRNKPA